MLGGQKCNIFTTKAEKSSIHLPFLPDRFKIDYVCVLSKKMYFLVPKCVSGLDRAKQI